MTAIRTGIDAFHNSYLDAEPQNVIDSSFGDWESRSGRYSLYWRMYQNNALDEAGVGSFAAQLKEDRHLSKYIEQLYNPAYRLVEVVSDCIWGGALDPEAGDGENVKTCLPIATDDERIRESIARLWRDSQWSIAKDTTTLYGACLGDVGLRANDHPESGRVSIEVVHPGSITWVSRDIRTKAITGYRIEETRPDPAVNVIRSGDAFSRYAPTVQYQEEAYLDNGIVHYRTLKDGVPYDWNGSGAEWDVTMPFIPLVLIAHKNIGHGWGHNAFHAHVPAFFQVDDQSSVLHIQIRKILKSPNYVAGTKGPSQLSVDDGRDDLTMLYGPTGSQPYPLTFPMPIADVTANIRQMLGAIEANYPELQADIATSSGDASGRALRVNRAKASKRIQARRESYDSGLANIMAMALAMGGESGYEAYAGFSLESYESLLTDFRISHRPVYEADPLDELEEEAAFLNNINAAIKAGIPLRVYLKRNGWTEVDIAEIEKAKADDQAKAMLQMQEQAALNPPNESAGPQSNPAKPGEPDRSAPPPPQAG